MDRKGFPESYGRKRLMRFVADIKSGQIEVTARSTRNSPTTYSSIKSSSARANTVSS